MADRCRCTDIKHANEDLNTLNSMWLKAVALSSRNSTQGKNLKSISSAVAALFSPDNLASLKNGITTADKDLEKICASIINDINADVKTINNQMVYWRAEDTRYHLAQQAETTGA
ncbi:MAG: hypothetical protein FWD65_06030 [Coriobacteriia bacterium]|nr:hypothetical protein [Coriobacteriia bacterium]